MHQLLFHSAALAHHLYVVKYVNVDMARVANAEAQEWQKLGPRFLTSWNLMVQTIYFTLAVITDLMAALEAFKNVRLERLVHTWKSYLFATLFVPWTLFVSVCFWALHTMNKHFVVPPAFDDIMPAWLNHALHTDILVFAAVEVAISRQRMMPTFSSAMFGNTVLTTMYYAIFYWTYFAQGRWLYGVYDVMTWTGRIMFTLFSYVSVSALISLLINADKKLHYK